VGEGASRDTRRRLTIDQAADQLGITVDAVRGRVKRDTITHEREGGRVYVLLDADQGADQGGGREGAPGEAEDRTAELIATLREQLQAEREANRENRRIIVALTSRIPEIEAARTVEEAPEGAEPRSDTGGAQEATQGAERRSWWRRMFGG
jgi:predicted ArsR family transcriptional regulator